jgi:hypothetical protein
MSVSDLEKLRLTLNPGESDERSYDIYPVQSVDISSRKEAFSVAPPGLAASENILLGISGKQSEITIRCSLWDSGQDRANGTHSSTVQTIDEQATYLEQTVQAPDFAASWQLDHLTGSAFNGDEVFFENVEPSILSQSNPKWTGCRIRLRRGQSI